MRDGDTMRQTLHQAVDAICDALDFAGHIQRARADLLRDLARMVAPYLQPVIIREPVYVYEDIIEAEVIPTKRRWRNKAARNTMPIACADTVVFIGHKPDKSGQPLVETEAEKPAPKADNRTNADILNSNTSDLTGLLKGLGVRVRKNATREELQQQVMNTLFGRV